MHKRSAGLSYHLMYIPTLFYFYLAFCVVLGGGDNDKQVGGAVAHSEQSASDIDEVAADGEKHLFFESPPAAKPVLRGEIKVETVFVAKMLMLTKHETKNETSCETGSFVYCENPYSPDLQASQASCSSAWGLLVWHDLRL